MTSTPQQPLSQARATAVVGELLRAGISDVVLCPGSRNAPLALAAVSAPGLTVHTRIDERAASFLALGMARVQRRPVAVIMTSGTAVANCVPAMIEAYYANVPLVVLSADRPARLHHTGASQTIEQAELFRGYAVETTIGADTDPEAAAAIAAEVLGAQRVHLNVEFDDPLVGTTLPAANEFPALARPRPATGRDYGVVDVDLGRKTLVVAGDDAWRVDGLEDVPTIAEPSAPAPYHPVHPLAAGIFAKEQISTPGDGQAEYVVDTKPEHIIIVGHPTLHRAVLRLLADPDIAVTVLSRSEEVTRPGGRDVAVATRVRATGSIPSQWLKICEAASELAAEAVREVLDSKEFGFSGLHAAAAVADTLAVGDTLVVGASNPVRDMSFVGVPFDGVDTFTPRGAAGIDGTVSQTFGVALATQALYPELLRPPRTVALVGDVTFLHDIGGLLVPQGNRRPENLTIVIANDDGGGIFETLEVGHEGLRDAFEQCFATPHAADIESLCAGFGVTYARAESLQELIEALIDTIDAGDGVTIIEARITRASRRAMHQALAEKLL
ncbi:2-succinyl-5-enolpyruvyl-6-hydroxy-3-cyclohexene-1-carboxylic-acid synthase [Corynebacterium sp. 13CS0277]|uniref:2-succinyl-5-enolpyruvyl-6-hydroxy-3- cyclohexene-1-carboxylic-acid synthase n=1 Tax=Corynebacterium sp. 13CS0277 TaxID=2071994 RepID=UPI000D0240E5|nr:2-succinyl-5-enolpyruvyl-6-hydroxy-3-cyclohexene-1-carboxylic-acid synthase [Corynebacterium sp. 13CS0277]PRQ10656.1 2-succinyl-5-enolpyruvyl-6-hydroxy-3-cyclohexene-1-carboxylic-acid synthase [Corynebacterium sp. 13CS0277]